MSSQFERLEETAGLTDSFMMRQKVEDVESKIGYQARSRASNDLNQLKSEATYLEQQVIQSRQNEKKLLDIVHQVYSKLDKQTNGVTSKRTSSNDPEMKQINRTLREIISQKAI